MNKEMQKHISEILHSKGFYVYTKCDRYEDDISPRHHDYYECYLITDGETEYNIEGQVLSLKSGDIMLVSPGEVHNPVAKSKESYARIVVAIDPKRLDAISTINTDLSICFKKVKSTRTHFIHAEASYLKRISACLELLLEQNRIKYGADILESINFMTFLIALNRMVIERGDIVAVTEKTLVDQATRYISDNIAADLSIEAIANNFLVSKFHLAHLFRKETGVTLHQYVLQKRLSLSKQYIMNGVAIIEVYKRCGFKDYSNFFRSFKEAFGITPKNFYKDMKSR